MYEVLVSGLEFTGHHGVTEQERRDGCSLRADVCAEVSGSAVQTDLIEDSVDYGALAALMVEVSDSARFHTLERLAQCYADSVFERFPSVASLEVQIDKPDPPVDLTVKSLGVRLSVGRPG